MKTQAQVSVSDTDFGQVAHHLKFYGVQFENSRTAFFHSLGIDYMTLFSQGFAIAVTHCQLKFLKSLYLNDEVCIETDLVKIRSRLAIFSQRMICNNELVATAKVNMVYAHLITKQSGQWPEYIYQRLKSQVSNVEILMVD